ncbi:MAG TPA: pyruvate kinase [Acidimicrobiia bacterium]|nr:pyruvate kinase [Acidimicrobiia bacterium]
MKRKTKVIATLGPASDSPEMIRLLIERGMNVARFNFSHGSHEDHARRFRLVRDIADSLDVPVAIMQDIQGPKIRVGEFPDGQVELVRGSTVTLVPGSGLGNESRVHVAYLENVSMEVGGKIMLADGLIELQATKVADDGVIALVVEGGILKDHKGAAFPGARTTVPVVTTKDEDDLAFGQDLGFDLLAASFVSSGRDIRSVRDVAGDLPIIAKIETALGYLHLDDILTEAAGAMVARGDLGVELSLESVPRAQTEILAMTNAAGKISITATEMLESMISAPRPTRAEVTDVYRSVIDGTDAVMLSAETAIGSYPDRAVRAMDVICSEAEIAPDWGRAAHISNLAEGAAFASATAEASVDTADRLGLSTIVAFTESGTTARLLSKYRPKADVFAFTPFVETYRRMAAYGGIRPMLLDRVHSTDDMIAAAEKRLLEDRLVERGEGVVMVAGVPPNQQSSTNLMKLHVIGSGDVLHPV